MKLLQIYESDTFKATKAMMLKLLKVPDYELPDRDHIEPWEADRLYRYGVRTKLGYCRVCGKQVPTERLKVILPNTSRREWWDADMGDHNITTCELHDGIVPGSIQDKLAKRWWDNWLIKWTREYQEWKDAKDDREFASKYKNVLHDLWRNVISAAPAMGSAQYKRLLSTIPGYCRICGDEIPPDRLVALWPDLADTCDKLVGDRNPTTCVKHGSSQTKYHATNWTGGK